MVNLRKGEKVSIGGLNKLRVGLGWKPNGYDPSKPFDLDASVFLLGPDEKVTDTVNDIVFYNQPKHPSGAVIHSGDALTGSESEGDDESIEVDLSKIPASIVQLSFVVTINDAVVREQNFGQVQDSYVKLYNSDTGEVLLIYELGEDFSTETAVQVCSIYNHKGTWKFSAVGAGFPGGLDSFCKKYGVPVE